MPSEQQRVVRRRGDSFRFYGAALDHLAMVDVLLEFGLAFCPLRPTAEQLQGIREPQAVRQLVRSEGTLVLKPSFVPELELSRIGFVRTTELPVLVLNRPNVIVGGAPPTYFWDANRAERPDGLIAIYGGVLSYSPTYSRTDEAVDAGAELRALFLKIVRTWKARCLQKVSDTFLGKVVHDWWSQGGVSVI